MNKGLTKFDFFVTIVFVGNNENEKGRKDMVYILYNPLAHSGHAEEDILPVKQKYENVPYEMKNLVETDVPAFLDTLSPDDTVVLCGGDGTLTRFARNVMNRRLPCEFFFAQAGTGNDFMRDVKDAVVDGLLPLNRYLENLPIVTVNGVDYPVVNGVGYGIDGMACQVAEDKLAKGETKIDYTAISIKLLLLTYKIPKATVTVDGVTKKYKRAWIAAGMNGRYYGGGMMVAPEQDRFGDTITSVMIHGGIRPRILILFPSIFEGKHVDCKKHTTVMSGKEITVEFDRPTALQIDGETIRNVTSYTMRAQKKTAPKEEPVAVAAAE